MMFKKFFQDMEVGAFQKRKYFNFLWVISLPKTNCLIDICTIASDGDICASNTILISRYTLYTYSIRVEGSE